MTDQSLVKATAVANSVSKRAPCTQLVMGTGGGLVTGYCTIKLGKFLALAMGGGILLIQLFVELGYVRVDWQKIVAEMEGRLAGTTQHLERSQGVRLMVGSNARLYTSFIGGVFLGIGIAI
ncbi:FUN14 domain-containing protein 2-like [Scaptodrosophila lebanonensis]|uniref:FUN14 domain-containing protein 2-like n=1 Tax=Drosophila lebanonensis TaxID=7225 RepID=A0A6J2T4F6_DROLE|nr:FUN14 domain-containing protein 2-like [Scaptodrosophila lebanonensis]